MPGPFIYGILMENFNARVAMGALMFSPILSVSTLWVAAHLIYRDNVLGYDKNRPIGTKRNQKASAPVNK